MPNTIPLDYLDLMERPVVVTLVTLMPDGQPQASPVWFTFDGTYIWVNTAKGRQKDKNMRERPQVTVLAIDPDNPYRYLEVRGVVAEITEDGGVEHINSLSDRHYGRPDFFAGDEYRRQREVRVIFKIRPEHVVAH